MNKHTIRIVEVSVGPEGSPLFAESRTNIKIVDEAGGEFCEVSQCRDGVTGQEVAFDPEEWPVIRGAIDSIVADINKHAKLRK